MVNGKNIVRSRDLNTKKPHHCLIRLFLAVERVERIELSYSAWKAGALPLCYTRVTVRMCLAVEDVGRIRLGQRLAQA